MTKIIKFFNFIIFAFLILIFSSSLAKNINNQQSNFLCLKNFVINHSGGTDKCGCHTNRKTGEYHCHKRKQRGGDCPS